MPLAISLLHVIGPSTRPVRTDTRGTRLKRDGSANEYGERAGEQVRLDVEHAQRRDPAQLEPKAAWKPRAQARTREYRARGSWLRACRSPPCAARRKAAGGTRARRTARLATVRRHPPPPSSSPVARHRTAHRAARTRRTTSSTASASLRACRSSTSSPHAPVRARRPAGRRRTRTDCTIILPFILRYRARPPRYPSRRPTRIPRQARDARESVTARRRCRSCPDGSCSDS